MLFFGIFWNPLRRAATNVSSELSLAREKRWRSFKRFAKSVVVLAAVAATLWYWHPELKVAGEFTVLPIHNADVRSEKEIADVKVGAKVVLKARAYPGQEFPGAVAAIAPVASQTNDWRNQRTILVVTELDNSSLQLRPGMTGLAKIYCGEQRAGALLGRRILRYLRVEVWSWW